MFTLYFNRNIKTPLYEQLYQFIQIEIKKGSFKAHEKMPSKRKLASHLEISEVTVDTAYQQLVAEGYLYTKPRSGFYVEPYYKPQILKAKDKIDDIKQKPKEKYQYDFKTNVVDTALFPNTTWAKLAREVLSENNHEVLNVTHPQGLYVLRKAIVNYLFHFRGISVNPEQIIVGAGSEALIGLLIQILGRDKIYGIENPGYQKIYQIFKANDVRTFPVAIDNQGVEIEALENVDVVHLTPSHQFPTGVVMPVRRRMELLKWANDNHYVIEDDYDSEFRFSGQPIPALYGLGLSDRVIYINSFTKSIAPSLRINYMVLPLPLLKKYRQHFWFHVCSVPNFEQYILAKFMEKGFFERHLNRMRIAYKNRLELLIKEINNSSLREYIQLDGHDAGLHFLMTVNNGMSEKILVETAKNIGIRVHGLSEYYHFQKSEVPKNTIVIGYSGLSELDIKTAIKKLAKVWIK